jgi:NADPH:quinone reductase-like Zn-dependent oxidoreductase
MTTTDPDIRLRLLHFAKLRPARPPRREAGSRRHAELVVVEADHLIGRPTHVSWDQAGALFVAGTNIELGPVELLLNAVKQ